MGNFQFMEIEVIIIHNWTAELKMKYEFNKKLTVYFIWDTIIF